MINIDSSKIAEMYVGSTKIGSAYLGSTKVYELSSPAPTGSYPTITNLKSGYYPNKGYGTGTTYWWIPRTSRLITGERPFFSFAKWGGSSTTTIVAVKSYSGDYSNFSFSGKVVYSKPSNQSRTSWGNTNSSNYTTTRSSMMNFTEDLGYTVLDGGVQSFSSNPFNGDWTYGDEGHLFNLTIEDDDLGYIIGNKFRQYQCCRFCEKDGNYSSILFTNSSYDLTGYSLNSTVSMSNWSGEDADGIMLQSSQSNFGWWWEV